MPDQTDPHESTHKETATNLKKLVAARGNLGGHFVFAGDGALEDAALFVSLTTRDPKGQRAQAQGKALRKAVKRARYALGTVEIQEDGKLVFLKASGSASTALIKKSFVVLLSSRDGLKVLKKARIQDQSGEDTPETEDSSPDQDTAAVTAEDLGMDAEDLARLEQSLREDPELAAFFDETKRQERVHQESVLLHGLFLSEAAAREERDTHRTQLIQELEVLDQALRKAIGTPQQDAVLRQLEDACGALAASSTHGSGTLGDTALPEDLRAISVLTTAQNLQQLARQHAALAGQITALYEAMARLPPEEQPDFALTHQTALQTTRETMRRIFTAIQQATQEIP